MPKRMSKFYSLTCTKLTLFTVSAVMIQLIGLSLFILGFFPTKPTLSGMSGLESFYPPGFDSTDLAENISTLPPEKLKSLYQGLSGVPSLFDKLIVMVIDGLPAEFVLGKDGKSPPKVFMEAMPYTQSLLTRGLAIGYHAYAAPPTVTMPRLKAMVSGAIGGFLDVATNFNTQAFLDDNLIAQFLRIGWKMVMHGDETWLKLFPNMFARHDGVSSFFVKDTIQVDRNVSRHLTDELNSTDWDLMILHYLGLDHVGHIGGRNSILMAPKLTEMDEVIKRIHSRIMQTQDINQRGTLLVRAALFSSSGISVSDHGMNEAGNHGGSTYEETDSLALFVTARKFSDIENYKKAYQVDIAATLALLFGVPIPKNNVGTVMTEVFSTLEAHAFFLFPQKEEQLLRILELNSWQLLRLLQTHFTESGCARFSCESGTDKNDGEEKLCCSYLAATALHESWKLKNSTRSVHGDDYRGIISAYQDFLGTASKWLSSRSTDKPIGLLALGLAAMLLSCLGLMTLLFLLGQEVNANKSQQLSHIDSWHLEETFIGAVTFLLIYSMGSSSMIEEEQYIWHFMTTSFCLILLRKTIQPKTRNSHSIYYIIAVLISGRILRGWHQGGVNWSYLPDIAKFLLEAGPARIKSMQLMSVFLIIIICSFLLLELRSKIRFLMLIYLFPVLIILKFVLKSSSIDTTSMIQIFYALNGTFTLGVLVFAPWLMPLQKLSATSSDVLRESQCKLMLVGFRDCVYIIGWCYVFSWCLLQMLLQQPVNSMPVFLLLVQILASIRYFSEGGLFLKKWVKVTALYYVGMAGHFGLGNTNTLATIDVAGAFIGISSHSTFNSGILMFMITYASLMLALLSMLMDVSIKDIATVANSHNGVDFRHLLKTTFAYPCLVPLGLNSILLVAYTVMLILMRNHLFVWSVFSPKYMYVCATTVCVYIGVSIVALTATYTCTVFATRTRLKRS